MTMNVRTQITLDPKLQQRAQAKAAELGISFAEYVRRLVAGDLGDAPARKPDVSVVFDLVDEGPQTNIALDKDKMIAEAVWHEHRSKMEPTKKTRGRRKATRP
jgi:hypothetical protein